MWHLASKPCNAQVKEIQLLNECVDSESAELAFRHSRNLSVLRCSESPFTPQIHITRIESILFLHSVTLNYQIDRSGRRRTVVEVKVEKDTSWQDTIFTNCLQALESGVFPQPEVRNIM